MSVDIYIIFIGDSSPSTIIIWNFVFQAECVASNYLRVRVFTRSPNRFASTSCYFYAMLQYVFLAIASRMCCGRVSIVPTCRISTKPSCGHLTSGKVLWILFKISSSRSMLPISSCNKYIALLNYYAYCFPSGASILLCHRRCLQTQTGLTLLQ